MWIEEFTIENIRCFEKAHIRFANGGQPYKWITFLSENGGGKSTILQAIGLLLAGPEAAQSLFQRPSGWLRHEEQVGKISARIHQGPNDPGKYGKTKTTKAFGYTFFVTGSKKLSIRNKVFTEPSIQESPDQRLTWLREKAFTSKGQGWFAVGYGAFRRLTRSSQIIVPTLEPPARFTNFTTQFNEDQPLSVFERWMVYLDYKIAKEKDPIATKQKDIGVDAINKALPHGVRFDSVTSEGRILFAIGNQRIPTISLSDGYRSVLALAGDLIWRLIRSFPDSDLPLNEEGVVLIDELDIHLHPVWQRDISIWLREQFPNLQFVVATHSPLIASGAGEDALTLRFSFEDGKSKINPIKNVSSMNVDRILQSEAFGLVSPYSPQAQSKIEKYDRLMQKGKRRSTEEESELQQLLPFMRAARPLGGPPIPESIEDRVEKYINKAFEK